MTPLGSVIVSIGTTAHPPAATGYRVCRAADPVTLISQVICALPYRMRSARTSSSRSRDAAIHGSEHGSAILPRLAVAAGERRVAIRDLPHGLDLARDVQAVARTASVRRPSVAVILTALRAAAKAMSPRGAPAPA